MSDPYNHDLMQDRELLISLIDVQTAKKIITSDIDCADCLCRVCARSMLNDCYNHSVEYKVCDPCNNCYLGDTLIETTADCEDFACDEEEE